MKDIICLVSEHITLLPKSPQTLGGAESQHITVFIRPVFDETRLTDFWDFVIGINFGGSSVSSV